MKKNEFEAFCNTIEKAGKDNDIWWCGQFFIELTDRQYKKVVELICQKSFINVGVSPSGKPVIILPSGIGIVKGVK